MEGESGKIDTEVNPVLTKPHSSNNFKYFITILVVVVVLILIGGGGYLLGQKNNKQEINTNKNTQNITSVPTNSPTPTVSLSSSITDTNIPGQKLYTNPKFGISFIFPEKFIEETIGVKELDSKIYVYDTKYPYTQGQYVEVFQKNPTDTLDQAIQKEFLTNISSKDCFVKDAKPDKGASFPVNYQVKTLGFPTDPNSDLPFFAQPNKCPATYAETNGISYFLGDTKHPNIFLFFSIGQYGFPITEKGQVTWQDTIEFLN